MYKVGTDIVNIKNFKDSITNGGDKLLRKLFTEHEAKNNNTESLAGIFAVKESFVKASGDKSIKFSEIEIRKNEEGRPFLIFSDTKMKFETDISISHDGDYAIAICIINL